MAGAGGTEVGRISIRVVPDTDFFRAELKKDLEKIEREIKGKVKVEADFDPRGLREKVAAATKAADAKIKINPEIEQSAFLRSLAEVKAAAKAADMKVSIDFRDGEAEAKLAETLAKLKAEAKLAHIKVNVDVDTNSAKRGLAGLFGGGASAAGGAGKALGGLGSFADTAVLVAAVAAVIAPALALISGAVAALPALLAGVLIPIGAVALGFKGIQDAAEAAGLLGEGKKGKHTIGQSLKDLQETLASKFKDGFTPIFEKLAPLVPALAQGLVPVADGVIKIAQSFTDMLTSPAVLKEIGATFDNIGRAMTVAAPGIADFSKGIIGLISGGSKSLPGFADLFNSMGKSVGGWVDDVNKPDFWGTSKLDRGLANFQTVLKSFGGLIGSIFKDSFDMMADPKFTKDMTKFIDGFKTFAHDVMPSLKGLFTDLANIVDGINKISKFNEPEWLKKAQEALNGPKDQKKPEGLLLHKPDGSLDAPLLNPDNYKNVLQFANLPALIIANWSSITGFFATLWGGIEQGAMTLGTSIQTAIGTVVGLIMQGFSNLGTIFGGIWDGLVASAQGAWTQVTGVVQGAISGVISAVQSIPGTLSGIWQGIVAAAQGAWDSIVSGISSAVGNIISIVSAVPGQIAGIFSSAAGILVGAGKAMMDGLLSGIKAGLSAVLDFAKSIAGQIAAVKGPLPKDRTTLTPAGQALMEGLQSGMEGGFQGVLDRARQLAGEISDAVNSGGPIKLGFKDQIKQELDEIKLETDQLKVARDATTDKGEKKALTEQMKQLQTVKDQLGLQRDQLGFSDKYGDKQNNITDQLGQQLGKMVDIGKNFGMANIKQFESDLGISGSGAIPTIAEAGIGWLTSTLGHLVSGAFGGGQGGGVAIHVNSVDDALAARQNIVNKQALQYAGR